LGRLAGEVERPRRLAAKLFTANPPLLHCKNTSGGIEKRAGCRPGKPSKPLHLNHFQQPNGAR
jgi:hypothetical protein